MHAWAVLLMGRAINLAPCQKHAYAKQRGTIWHAGRRRPRGRHAHADARAAVRAGADAQRSRRRPHVGAEHAAFKSTGPS